jgi:hypothetical protein
MQPVRSWGRKKRWNYWCITTRTFVFLNALPSGYWDWHLFIISILQAEIYGTNRHPAFGKGCDFPKIGRADQLRIQRSAWKCVISGNDIYAVGQPAFGGEKLHAVFQFSAGGTETIDS